jgi:hypothetical protein
MNINQRGRFCIIEGCATLTLSGMCERHRQDARTGVLTEQERMAPESVSFVTASDMDARKHSRRSALMLCEAAEENDDVVNYNVASQSPEQAAMISNAVPRYLAAARQRLTVAKDAWTRCAVSVLRREPGAGDAVGPALAELQAAHADLDALNRRAIEESRR